MKKIYLHQFLSKSGIFKSKNELIQAIKNSEIKISNKIITNPRFQFNSKTKLVTYKNKPVKSLKNKVYILINKPEGYLSSKLTDNDIRLKKRTIFDLIKVDEQIKKTLFSVGRLDEISSGLLIITNDGKLCSEIIDPKNNIKKTYQVILRKPISQEDIRKIEQGIIIDLEENGIITKYKTKESKINLETPTKLTIVLTEGKKREIKRIFEAVNNEVIKLERIAIGNLKDLSLKPGQYKVTDLKFIKERIKSSQK